MEFLSSAINIFLHLDEYLAVIIDQYGILTYVILFSIIFLETGVVITPFLPGDSLLFAAGTFSALGDLNPLILYALLSAAAIIGDSVNYTIGNHVGERAFSGKIRWLKKEYFDRTHAFYEKHGGKTIFLARFVPIIRTFAPFVAGVGKMSYGYFLTYNVVGAIVWVGIFVTGGYYFGNLSVVKDNFTLVILMIIIISVLPAVYEVVKSRSHKL